MRKAAAILLLAGLLAGLGGPSVSAAGIGAILTGYVQGFWRGVTKGMTDAAIDNKVPLLVRSPADGAALDEQKNIQLSMIDFMLREGVAAIVLAPEPVEGVDTPLSPRVPLVLIDRPSPYYDARSIVATDNFAAGRKAALSLTPVLRQGARVAVLRLAANIPSTTAREEGFLSVAREQGWTVALDTFVGYRFREAEDATAAALRDRTERLDAVFVPNESVAYGAVRVVGGMPPETRPRLVAFDWRPEFREALASGVLYATVLQDTYRMGYRAVVAAVKASRGETLPPAETIDVTVVTRANMDDRAVRTQAARYVD